MDLGQACDSRTVSCTRRCRYRGGYTPVVESMRMLVARARVRVCTCCAHVHICKCVAKFAVSEGVCARGLCCARVHRCARAWSLLRARS
eukprot:940344-Alexandrium_andersonii.AAC.1